MLDPGGILWRFSDFVSKVLDQTMYTFIMYAFLLIKTTIYKKGKYEKWGKFEELVETAERLFFQRKKKL